MPSQVSIVDLPGSGGEKREEKKTPPKGSTSKRPAASDTDLKSRLHTVFDRLADAADARGDDELSAALREDRDVMAQSLVTLTRPFQALRTPLLGLLAIMEPVIAFNRIGRLLFGRVVDRRAERTAHKEDVGPGN